MFIFYVLLTPLTTLAPGNMPRTAFFLLLRRGSTRQRWAPGALMR